MNARTSRLIRKFCQSMGYNPKVFKREYNKIPSPFKKKNKDTMQNYLNNKKKDNTV